MLRGLYPRRHLLLERENPRTLFGINQQHNGGYHLPEQQENSRELLLLQPRRLHDAYRAWRAFLARSGSSDCGGNYHQRHSELVA